jgi:plastocyanin
MSPNRRKLIIRLAGGAVLLGILLAGLLLTVSLAFAHDRPQPRTWHLQVGAQSSDQAIQGMAFLPADVWINVGDTIVWTVQSAEIHTVTFLPPGQTPPPFNQNDPKQVLPQGGSVYDGTSYYNSGLMSTMTDMPVPGGQRYRLTFGVTGDFTFYCLVHPGMIGHVHVRPAGTPYPFSQSDYDRQAAQARDNLLRDGEQLTHQAEAVSDAHHVTVGIGDGLVTIMRFFPSEVHIHVGDSIVFTSRDVMEPHTVTFGPDQPQGNFAPYGTPTAFDGSTPLNSGFLGPHFPFGTTYTVTFVKAGSYAFRCDLHDMLGMLLSITVGD